MIKNFGALTCNYMYILSNTVTIHTYINEKHESANPQWNLAEVLEYLDRNTFACILGEHASMKNEL